jgi:hypothetical protein
VLEMIIVTGAPWTSGLAPKASVDGSTYLDRGQGFVDIDDVAVTQVTHISG